ncbi:hypothetical protein JB92DRAFT_3116518 [Gautieria morchelliformis]|nr:hypothetical protein JB92DRAFT_3116518 [Gautieria morchelliformis]
MQASTTIPPANSETAPSQMDCEPQLDVPRASFPVLWTPPTSPTVPASASKKSTSKSATKQPPAKKQPSRIHHQPLLDEEAALWQLFGDWSPDACLEIEVLIEGFCHDPSISLTSLSLCPLSSSLLHLRLSSPYTLTTPPLCSLHSPFAPFTERPFTLASFASGTPSNTIDTLYLV